MARKKKARITSTAGKNKVRKALHDFKHGAMHSGSKRGPVVKNRRQAIAIALSQGDKAQRQARRKNRARTRKRGR